VHEREGGEAVSGTCDGACAASACRGGSGGKVALPPVALTTCGGLCTSARLCGDV
jgi:hypothetical protein